MHTITEDTRLVSSGVRLRRRIFHPSDPHGWAEYHSVEEPDGTLWIHCHGLQRWKLPDLELVGVPGPMKGHAHQLLFEIIALIREEGIAIPDMNLTGEFSAPLQSFQQMITFRCASHDDPEHRGILRIVDRDDSVEMGFPRRLFAAHIAAWSEFSDNPQRREAMCRRALAMFPGDYLEMSAGGDVDPEHPDLTDLQFRANLSVYLSLSHALFEQGRFNESFSYLEEAIARCPGWAANYRYYVLRAFAGSDPLVEFWHNADIPAICARRRPASAVRTVFGRKGLETRKTA